MSADNEMAEGLTTVGLTNESHEILKQLKKDGIFKEMVDGYRFGIALAIAYGNIAPEDIKTNTIFNIGTLDPDDKIQMLLKSHIHMQKDWQSGVSQKWGSCQRAVN
jgi:hypothetical protein